MTQTQEKNIEAETNVKQELTFNDQISKIKTNINLEIRMSDQSGRGIFALQNIPSGIFTSRDYSRDSVDIPIYYFM
jgi:hypothetical protein